MRLAPDALVIAHGNTAVRIRPSLRAAIRLERKFGLAAIVDAIAMPNFDLLCEILSDAADDHAARHMLSVAVARDGFGVLIEMRPALFQFFYDCFRIGDDIQSADAPGEPTKPAALYARLYEIATGWLGWSPADAWAATPHEIVVAQRGLIERLTAIYGSAEKQDDKPAVYDDRRDPPGKLAAFAAKHGRKR